jgi:peptidoglycan/xylan/chitin deacetylase (PgdA/CDA1 family)
MADKTAPIAPVHHWPTVPREWEQTVLTDRRRGLAMTVDFEDYRRQELRDHFGEPQLPHPNEVERQLDLLLDLLEGLDARATFFSVGRLTGELRGSIWGRISGRHYIGCHGYEHLPANTMGRQRFRQDLKRAKAALEDASGQTVLSYRAPYFSSEGTDVWFGEVLAGEGFRVDSSRRITAPPAGCAGAYVLEGSHGCVLEAPLASIGYGPKRLTVIGGTYFRLLPLTAIRRLLSRAEDLGFLPMVYLHPYDIDPLAPPLPYPLGSHAQQKLGDWVRRRGRGAAAGKLCALADTYEFKSLEAMVLASA